MVVLGALLVGCARQLPVPGLEPVAVPDGVTVLEDVETYPVAGADRATIGAALRAGVIDSNGRRYAGYHSWRITWSFGTRLEFGLCSLVRVTVTLTSTVTLPLWTPPPGVDLPLVTQWEEYRRALAVHERGHRAITYAGAGRVLRAIRGVSDQSCAFIGKSVSAAAEPVIAAIRSEDAQYDATTRHGATQGAIWRQ